MLYSLPDGRVIYLDLDSYLSMSDISIHELILDHDANEINNPFHGSVLKDKKSYDPTEVCISNLRIDEIEIEDKMLEIQDDYFSDT